MRCSTGSRAVDSGDSNKENKAEEVAATADDAQCHLVPAQLPGR